MGSTKVISRKLHEFDVVHSLSKGFLKQRSYRAYRVELDMPLLIRLDYCRTWIPKLRDKIVSDGKWTLKINLDGNHIVIPQMEDQESIVKASSSHKTLLTESELKRLHVQLGHMNLEGIINVILRRGKDI